MSYELKTNTAVRLAVGPLVDPGDGKTAETSLTVTALLVQIYRIQNDGNAVVRAAFNPTTDSGDNDMVLVTSSTDGMYDLEITAAQINWLGNGRISFYDVDGFLVHYFDIHVVSAAYWNWKYATTIPEVNVKQLLGTAWLAPGTAGTPDVNAKQLGGTAQTGRDIGASVLLSTGSGAGQLDFTSGVVKSNLAQILGTALTETAGYIAAGFKKLFNVETPVLVASDVMRGTDTGPTKAEMDTAHALLATPANVNTQVLDVLTTDTFAEPGTGAPPATASIEEKISWLYAFLRNKTLTTSSLLTLRNDADNADIAKATLSDDTTTFSKEEFVSG